MRGRVRGERERRGTRVVNVTEEESDKFSCALAGPPEPLCMSFILSPFFHELSLSHWYSFSSLAALIILSLAYSRFRGLFGQDNKNMLLTVKWGRERFVHFIPLSPPDTPCPSVLLRRTPPILHLRHPDPHTHSLQIPLPPLDTKLAALRQTLSEHTHLAPNAFKLIYAGAVMKDDDVPRESPLLLLVFRRFHHVSSPLLLPCQPTAISCPSPHLILRHSQPSRAG